MQNRSLSTQKGFTLIELMVVMAIIGILASIALPTYQTYTTRAQMAEALTISGELKPLIKEYYKARGTFPASNQSLGAPEPRFLIGNYVKGATIEGGAVHLELGNKINALLAGKILTLRPAVVDGSPTSPFAWLCGYSKPVDGMSAVGENETNVPSQFLPPACNE